MKILKMIGAMLLVIGIAYVSTSIPYQRLFYIFQKPATEEQLKTVDRDYSSIGTKAESYVPTAGSLSDIKSQTYFTIETDSLIPTGLYGLLDSSREGKYYVGTRQNPSQITVPYFTESKTTVLLNAMEYGRYYIAKLSDGNSIIVLIDDTLFSINKGKTIRLPVGVKMSHPKSLETGLTFASYFKKNAEKYQLEDTDWYVNMASKSFHNAYRLPVMVMQWVGGFLNSGGSYFGCP